MSTSTFIDDRLIKRLMSDMNMDLHLIPENDNDHNDDPSSSSATEDDSTDPSSLFDNESSPAKTAEQEKRRKAFIEREEKHVRTVRRALAIAILICSIVVSSSVYVLARRSEHHSFTHEVCLLHCALRHYQINNLHNLFVVNSFSLGYLLQTLFQMFSGRATTTSLF